MSDIERIENKIDMLLEGQQLANKILLTTSEVGVLFGMSEHVLRNARTNHNLKHVLVDSKKIMYKREDIEAYIEKCTV